MEIPVARLVSVLIPKYFLNFLAVIWERLEESGEIYFIFLSNVSASNIMKIKKINTITDSPTAFPKLAKKELAIGNIFHGFISSAGFKP